MASLSRPHFQGILLQFNRVQKRRFLWYLATLFTVLQGGNTNKKNKKTWPSKALIDLHGIQVVHSLTASCRTLQLSDRASTNHPSPGKIDPLNTAHPLVELIVSGQNQICASIKATFTNICKKNSINITIQTQNSIISHIPIMPLLTPDKHNI